MKLQPARGVMFVPDGTPRDRGARADDAPGRWSAHPDDLEIMRLARDSRLLRPERSVVLRRRGRRRARARRGRGHTRSLSDDEMRGASRSASRRRRPWSASTAPWRSSTTRAPRCKAPDREPARSRTLTALLDGGAALRRLHPQPGGPSRHPRGDRSRDDRGLPSAARGGPADSAARRRGLAGPRLAAPTATGSRRTRGTGEPGAALIGVFDSQIAGGKRHDLAVLGRRRANATYNASHARGCHERPEPGHGPDAFGEGQGSRSRGVRPGIRGPLRRRSEGADPSAPGSRRETRALSAWPS